MYIIFIGNRRFHYAASRPLEYVCMLCNIYFFLNPIECMYYMKTILLPKIFSTMTSYDCFWLFQFQFIQYMYATILSIIFYFCMNIWQDTCSWPNSHEICNHVGYVAMKQMNDSGRIHYHEDSYPAIYTGPCVDYKSGIRLNTGRERLKAWFYYPYQGISFYVRMNSK